MHAPWGLGLPPVPDAGTIWLYLEQPTPAGVGARLFRRFDTVRHEAGCSAEGRQIPGATVVWVRPG